MAADDGAQVQAGLEEPDSEERAARKAVLDEKMRKILALDGQREREIMRRRHAVGELYPMVWIE